MSVKQQTKEQKTKKENTPLCRPRSFVFAIVLPCVVLPFALPFVTAIRGAAGRCFAGSCCCRSSLLVAAAGSCCCSVSAAGSCCCAFEIYYQVGLGRVSPTPTTKKNKKGRYSAFPAIPPWRRHLQPATPPLFGGVFSKIRHAFPPWPPFDNTLLQQNGGRKNT